MGHFADFSWFLKVLYDVIILLPCKLYCITFFICGKNVEMECTVSTVVTNVQANCRDRSVCSHVTGQCDRGCDAGWTGLFCYNGNYCTNTL